jgi:integrase
LRSSGGLADRWRDKSITAIDGHDIHAVVDETRHKGVPGLVRRREGPTESQARKLFSTLSKMFNWLAQHRRLESNPCTSVHRPEAPVSRDRFLDAGEIVKFWQATDQEPLAGALLKLTLLTGCRLNEVADMRRSELSADLSIWNIPGSRTKNHKAHVVPLPPLARALIANTAGESDLVFTTTGTTPISGWSKIKRRLDQRMQVPAWEIHDLRRTFVTGCAELGIRPDVIELAVNHISGSRGGIAGIYNRSELLPEPRAALERWANHIEGLVAGHAAKVVPLHA